MIEESNYGDAYSLDIEASKAAVEKYGEFIDEYEKKEQAEQAVEAEKTAEQKQRVDEQVDPRNADSWGAKAFIKKGSLFYLVVYKILRLRLQHFLSVQ